MTIFQGVTKRQLARALITSAIVQTALAVMGFSLLWCFAIDLCAGIIASAFYWYVWPKPPA